MFFDREKFKEFYWDLTFDEESGKGFYPYEYQVEVAKCLIEGKNIILSVPTGAGKTWASIMPFLFAKSRSNINFPQKMIYSLPLRALCNSISQDVKEAVKKTDFEGLSSIQTGEFGDDKYFENDIVFSTIDQTLSNFLCFPLALSPRQANINAGALVGSYLVFDEFHLLEDCRSMATTLGMLKMLGNMSRFCIMTATLSEGFMENLQNTLSENNLEVEIITLDGFKEDVVKIGSLQIPTNQECKKEIEVVEGKINGEKIRQYHKDKTIVICNRVETAQRIYMELEDWAKEKGVKLVCLHSRFFDSDRKQYEQQLKGLFGKKVKDEKKNAILIATQVIEAGMDISCEVMHTEIAPINALLQRVGRCARYENQYGKIFVYDVLSIEEKAQIAEADFENLSKKEKAEIYKLNKLYLPYDKDLCKATLDALKLSKNQKLTEKVMIRLVDEILKGEEKRIWEVMNPMFNIPKIQCAWRESVENKFGAKNHYRHTIRNIQSIDLVIISNPSFAEKYPYSLESISIFKWSLVKLVKEVLEEVDTEMNWVVGVVEESTVLGFDLEEGERNLSFREIKDIQGVIAAFDTLYLNSAYFHYDTAIGFNKEKGKQYSGFKDRKEKEEIIHAYRKDTFVQHTKGLLGAFKEDFLSNKLTGEQNKLDFIFMALNERFGANANFKKLIQLILILHDYGKLDVKWQGWMQAYQKALASLQESPFTYQENVPLGHTGFDTKEQKERLGKEYQDIVKTVEEEVKAKRGSRPRHSGVGAKVLMDILEEWAEEDDFWEDLVAPAAIAIARHHGMSNTHYHGFEISAHNYQAIQALLAEYGFDELKLQRRNRKKEELRIMDYTEFDQYLLYLFFVRILRLCDQKATDDFEKYQ